MEIEDDIEDLDEVDSARSVRMEMVEVIKLSMSLDMPKSNTSHLPFKFIAKTQTFSDLHPHKMDLIMIAKVRPTKVPKPSTKKDGRKEVN